MKFKKLIILIVVNLLISGAFFIAFSNYILKRVEASRAEISLAQPSANFVKANQEITDDMTDLRYAAKTAMPAVVYVKAKFPAQQKDTSKVTGNDIFIDGMLGQGIGSSTTAEQRTSGSGPM